MDTRAHREAAEHILRELDELETDREGDLDAFAAAWYDRMAKIAQVHATLASYRP